MFNFIVNISLLKAMLLVVFDISVKVLCIDNARDSRFLFAPFLFSSQGITY